MSAAFLCYFLFPEKESKYSQRAIHNWQIECFIIFLHALCDSKNKKPFIYKTNGFH